MLSSQLVCFLFLAFVANGLRFDVTEVPTCLVYTVERIEDMPRVELKFVSNYAEESRPAAASQLHIQTLDPNKREVNLEKIVARPAKSATWKVARFMHRDDQSGLGRQGFSLAGDYSLCFKRMPSAMRKKGLQTLPDEDERAYVELLIGDPRSLRLLEKQTVATKGSSAKYTGSVRARSDFSKKPHEPLGEGESDDHLTSDEAEELNEWFDEIATLLEDVEGNFIKLLDRHQAFQTTSNSLYTRVWFMAILTIAAMGGTMTFMFTKLKRTLIEKKLV